MSSCVHQSIRRVALLVVSLYLSVLLYKLNLVLSLIFVNLNIVLYLYSTLVTVLMVNGTVMDH